VPQGYTLIEIVVAVFVFCVGGLALASTSAVIARELSRDARRAAIAREAANRTEVLISQCAPRRLRC
jgi:prepilin-type N-terminal cleavage/methylation domain-containing protein